MLSITVRLFLAGVLIETTMGMGQTGYELPITVCSFFTLSAIARMLYQRLRKSRQNLNNTSRTTIQFARPLAQGVLDLVSWGRKAWFYLRWLRSCVVCWFSLNPLFACWIDSGLPLAYVGFALIYIAMRFDLFSIGLLVLLYFCLRLVASACACLRLLALACACLR